MHPAIPLILYKHTTNNTNQFLVPQTPRAQARARPPQGPLRCVLDGCLVGWLDVWVGGWVFGWLVGWSVGGLI
jgi:hypothetical protein